jgi:hypothetical protein
MEVNTKAIIRKGTSLEEIETHLKSKYSNVKCGATNTEGFFSFYFEDWNEKRIMFVSFHDTTREYLYDGVLLSLDAWGNAVPIMRDICETFGGYLDKNDCDDESFYPINLHLFEQGTEFTKMDMFRHKVMCKLGYKNWKIALELFEEFKSLNH